ncbi:hypothetical protein ACFE04_024398 [Oxalis oulophora]
METYTRWQRNKKNNKNIHTTVATSPLVILTTLSPSRHQTCATQPPPYSVINTTFPHSTVATLTALHRRARSETTTTDNSLSPCNSPIVATTPDGYHTLPQSPRPTHHSHT